jgi:IS5 family transposase
MASEVWADRAYRSDELEEKLAARGLKSRIHRRAYRNRKLSEAQRAANTTRSNVRDNMRRFVCLEGMTAAAG